MTIEQAIQKAIEGGYSFQNELYSKDPTAKYFISKEALYKAFLDPLFWQALGKSLGWEEKDCTCNGYSSQCRCEPEWYTQCEEFWHVIMHGGTIESYFETL